MALDRSPGSRLDEVIKTAVLRSRVSVATARALLDANFPGPAYVWAVRSIEVYLKEVMLLPLFLEQFDGDWNRAWKKVKATFGSAGWNPALKLIDEAYGPLDPMVTDDGRDVWDVWKSVVVGYRGDIVHGVSDPLAADAETVVAWAEQMMIQLPLRLIVAAKHPLHDLFVAALQAAGKALNEDGRP